MAKIRLQTRYTLLCYIIQFTFLLVTFRILQRWIIEFKVARGEDVYDPAHPERNTPESFIHANADMPEKESNEIESLIEANTPSGKEKH